MKNRPGNWIAGAGWLNSSGTGVRFGMHPVTVATFNEGDKARRLKEALEQNGIQARVHDETRLQRYLFYSKPLASKKVQVDETDFERADKLVQAWDKDPLMEGAVHCPQCSSSRVEFPQYTRKFVIPNIIEELFVALGFVNQEFYCENCHHTWPAKPEKPLPPMDALGWPMEEGKQQPWLARFRTRLRAR